MTKYILTVLGRDRPGIIAAVSNILYGLDCNLENVNQMILQNEFAGFFILQPPDNLNSDILKAELDKRLEDEYLHVHVQQLDTEDSGSGIHSQRGESFIISAIGPDQKGLVARISQIIAEYNANITNLEAVFRGGDEPSDNIMSYEVFITDNIERRKLFDALQQKARELNLDIRIQHKNIFNIINKI